MLWRSVLGLFGLFHLANGLFIVGDPEDWYRATPGVGRTGPMNHHFLVDIGLAFVASGAGMLIGLRPGRVAATLALAGATWPALHAVFHIWEWFTGGLPHDPHAATAEAVGVVLVGLSGFTLAASRARKEGAI